MSFSCCVWIRSRLLYLDLVLNLGVGYYYIQYGKEWGNEVCLLHMVVTLMSDRSSSFGATKPVKQGKCIKSDITNIYVVLTTLVPNVFL